MTKTGQAHGPLEMHHHRKPTPASTPEQASAIEDSRKVAGARRSGKLSVTAQTDPFAIFPNPEPDPFA